MGPEKRPSCAASAAWSPRHLAKSSLKDLQPILKAHQVVALGIAVVPEGRGIFSKMTVEENLRSGLVFFDPDPIHLQERLEDAYQRFPVLKERRKQVAGTLSGGEQSMLSVSRAMMRKPRLLMMDEPSLGLSPKLVEQTFEIVRELRMGYRSCL